MSLQECKECGQNVSIKANICPHCGAPQRRSKLIIIVILVFSIGCIVGLSVSFSAKITNFLNLAFSEKKEHKVDLEKPIKEGEPKTTLDKQVTIPTHKFKKNFFENAKYTYYTRDKKHIIELINGKYEREEKDNYLLVNLEGVCFGDLNGDGIEDAAVVLSKSFVSGLVPLLHLFVVLSENKDPDIISNVVRLHGSILNSIGINNKEIVIDSLKLVGLGDQKVTPTLKIVEKYKLVDNKIVEVKPPSQRAQNAIAALRKLQAKTEVGINYGNYVTSLGDTKYQVDLYLKSDERLNHSMFNKEIPKHISKAMEYYLLAKLIWSYKFGPRNPRQHRDALEENIKKEFGEIDNNSQLGEVIHKYYPKIGSYYVDNLLPIIWSDAAKEIEIASRLIK